MKNINAIQKKLQHLKRYIAKDLPEIIGTEAVNHYTQNFDKQGFDGKKWKEVKRREPSSVWYGFSYGDKQRKPSTHPSRKNASRPYKPRKENPTTNYAKAATRTPILSSQKSELENSLRYKISGGRVTIYSDKPYSRVHNEGGRVKVFGKKSVILPKRQFVGKSSALERHLKREIAQDIARIMR